MELVKKNIHMNRWKGNITTQITLDDDFIVPDTMDDVAQVILDSGEIQVENTKVQGEKAVIKGKLNFQVLYRREEGGLQALGGSIPFEETVNVPGLLEKDFLQFTWELEDLSAAMINSRKLSVKGLVTFQVRVESLQDVEAAVEVNGNGECLYRSVEVAAIAARKKDTYRIREEVTIPGNKPNIQQILWSEMKLQGVSTKPLDGQIHVEGELVVFVIYSGEGEDMPLQWLEDAIHFSGNLEMPDVIEEMIPSIGVRLIHKDLTEKPDSDGEMRILEIDGVVELDIKLYEEEEVHLLSDLYSTAEEVVLEKGEASFDRLLTKNAGKCKVSEKVKMPDTERILQICHSDGVVKMDEMEMKEDGIHMDGVVEVRILYLTDDDSEPLKSVTEVVPFHYVAEASGADDNSINQLNTGLEQLSAVMLGGDAVEIKGVVVLDLLVLQPITEPVILSARTEPLDVQKLQELPGIVGYIVQPGDTLWSVARKFHTTMDNVMAANGLAEPTVKQGAKLILVKEVSGGLSEGLAGGREPA